MFFLFVTYVIRYRFICIIKRNNINCDITIIYTQEWSSNQCTNPPHETPMFYNEIYVFELEPNDFRQKQQDHMKIKIMIDKL